MICLLAASYSCRFVLVARRDGLSPFFLGVWKVEGGVAAGQGFLDNTNECISWTDTPFYRDGGVRAAKVFAVLATLMGTVVWVLVGTAAVQPVGRPHRMIVSAGSCACAVTCVLLFSTFAADVCDHDDLSCGFGAGSYLSLTATVLWTVTAVLSFLWTRHPVTDGDNASTRDLVTVATTHSTPTVPTGRAMRTTEYRHGSHRASPPRPETTQPDKSSPKAAVTEDPWQEREEEDGQRQRSYSQNRSSPVDLDEELGVDDMPPIGSPLVSVTEDEHGNLIRTTITRTVDSRGRTIIDRTSQRIDDNDTAESASV